MSLEVEGSFNGGNVEIHLITLTGTTAVSTATKFSRIKFAFACWAEEPDNPTYQLYPSSISGGTVDIKCTHATTVTAYLVVIGLT